MTRRARTPLEIATAHAERLDKLTDQQLFMDTFVRYRKVAPSVKDPLDLETVCVRLTKSSHVMEAAMIEALASLRAEGHRL